MHLNRIAYQLASLLVAFPASALKLLPIPIGQFEAASGLRRREFDQSLDFQPQSQAQLFYGLADGGGKAHLANITLQAPLGLPIVLLEHLDPIIEYVDCTRDDGQIALAFKSRNAFQRAVKEWNFVNQNIEHKFLLITNHDGCSLREERQPHIVTEIREDAAFLTTYLKFKPVDFSDVSDNFELNWSQYEQRQPSSRARERPRDVAESANDQTNDDMHPTGTNLPSDESNSSGEGSDEPVNGGTPDESLLTKIQQFFNNFANPPPRSGDPENNGSPSDYQKGAEDGEDPGKSYLEQMQDMWTKLREKTWDPPKGISTDNGPLKLSGAIDGVNEPDSWVWDWTNKGTPLLINIKTDSKKQFKLGSNIKGDVKAFCTDCVVKGSFLFTLKIAKVDGVVKAGSVTINVSNLKVSGTTSVTRSGADVAETVSNNDKIPLELSAEHDVIGSPVPEYGLQIGDWVTLGLNWAYQLGLGASFSGNWDLGLKYMATLDGNALLTLDLFENNNNLVNLNLLKYQNPVPTIRKLEGPVTVNLHGKLTVSFGIKVGQFKIELAVFMPLPEIQVAMKVLAVKGGVCEAEGVNTGVVLESRINVQVRAGGVYSAGELDQIVGDQPLSPNWGKLLSLSCVAVDLPGISTDGDKPPDGTTPPGKPPAVPNAAPVPGNKEEDKTRKPCDSAALEGDLCPGSTDNPQKNSAASSQSGDQASSLQAEDQSASVQAEDQTSPQQPESQSYPQSQGGSIDSQPLGDATAFLQPENQAASLPSTVTLVPSASDDTTPSPQPEEDQAVSFPSAVATDPSIPPTDSIQQDASTFEPSDNPNAADSAVVVRLARRRLPD